MILPAHSIAQHPSRNQALISQIQARIIAAGGWISFAEFMRHALYAPYYGYYQTLEFGADFTTAPEITPLFGRSLARQIKEVLQSTGGDILELGAGSGKLALTLLQQLATDGTLPNRYYIVEPSTGLRQQQLQRLRDGLPITLFKRLKWLTRLPQQLCGVVLGNEVLDALPVHIIARTAEGFCEHGVTWNKDRFEWKIRVLDRRSHRVGDIAHLPPGYVSEICPAAKQLVRKLAKRLTRGLLLWIDYGFPVAQYYHPQRKQGTLMCHFKHQAHTDPLVNVGMQDISAHVNFSAIASTAGEQDLEVAGFCSQAQFLLNCGILQLLSKFSPDDVLQYTPQARAVQQLLSPAEMGELFYVLALSRNLPLPLLGFRDGDKAHRLLG